MNTLHLNSYFWQTKGRTILNIQIKGKVVTSLTVQGFKQQLATSAMQNHFANFSPESSFSWTKLGQSSAAILYWPYKNQRRIFSQMWFMHIFWETFQPKIAVTGGLYTFHNPMISLVKSGALVAHDCFTIMSMLAACPHIWAVQ